MKLFSWSHCKQACTSVFITTDASRRFTSTGKVGSGAPAARRISNTSSSGSARRFELPRYASPQYMAGDVLRKRVDTCTCIVVAATSAMSPSLKKYAPTKAC